MKNHHEKVNRRYYTNFSLIGPKYIYRVRQTTCTHFIATLQSLIEAQNQFQPPYFVLNEFEKITWSLWKNPFVVEGGL